MKKKLITLLMAAMLLVSISATALAADSSVTYEGGAEKFVFVDDDDLFDNFKGVMPGDTVTQTVYVQNLFTGVDRVRIYLRAELHDEEGNPLSDEVAAVEDVVSMYEFLSQLSMVVKQGDKVLFSATADQLGGLKENVSLGVFSHRAKTAITIELTVPAELGNEYANRMGEIDWVFTAEEIPDVEGPDTGDNSQLLLWGGLMLVGAAAVVVLVVAGKKKKAE